MTKAEKDLVFRKGGDEFVVLMMDADEHVLQKVTKRIFDELNRFVIVPIDPTRVEDETIKGDIRFLRPNEAPTHQISVSIGALLVNCYDPRQMVRLMNYINDWNLQKSDPLLEAADKLLYEAKTLKDPNRMIWEHFAENSPEIHIVIED